MANYLEGVDTTRSDSPVVVGGGLENLRDSNFDNINGNEARVRAMSPVAMSSSDDPGSKPMALHTEYAQGESNEMAYTTEDIVFYLRKAGS